MLRQRNLKTNSQEKLLAQRTTLMNSTWWQRLSRQRWFKVTRKTAFTLGVIYLALPVWFYFCPWIRRQCVFLHNFHWPPFETSNLSQPAFWNIPCARNFYLESEKDVKLGVWHIFPEARAENCQNKQLTEANEFDDSRPIILYFHGNSMNRAALYRRELYRVLTKNSVNAHVITFDYRGFGDSSPLKPSVEALVRDAKSIYKWLITKVPRSRVIIWGHSLGSGIAIQLAAKMSAEESPSGIVLESPFTNIPDATKSFPLSILHRKMPYFDMFFSDPTRHPDTNFDTDAKIMFAKVPLMILHAADDSMVNVAMGRKLRDIAQQKQSVDVQKAEYHEFENSLGYGHLFISRSPKLPGLVNTFIEKVCHF